MTDVVLVSMPFGTVFYPSIGLSLLKAGLARQRVSVGIRYFNLVFAERIGAVTYANAAITGPFQQQDLTGEWVFSQALTGCSPDMSEGFLDGLLVASAAGLRRRPVTKAHRAILTRARAHADGFLADCLQDLTRERPRIVGFTSSFQQHVASLALARRLKQHSPSTFIVLGGANCEGPMGAETLRQFPFVDAVVSGEGDVVFPELVQRVLQGTAVADLEGVRTHERLAQEFAFNRFPNTPPIRDLDTLPYPDYTDYFEQFARTRLAARSAPGLFAETSRGCWWGERSHCTFCGLNGTTMTFRSKSPARALKELRTLEATYPGADIQLVDTILDLDYFKSLLPGLTGQPLALNLFYETKSNLKKEQVRLLKAAGVSGIQPGIESFSDDILKMMRKGVSGIQNVQLLKWCKEIGIDVIWNLIWGFAGEPPSEYTRMATLVPALLHLPPPYALGRLRLDRFSPSFMYPGQFGYANIRPAPSYQRVYALPERVLANLAYYFVYDYATPQEPEKHVAPLLRAAAQWRAVHEFSDLFSVDAGGVLMIWDFRMRPQESTGRGAVLQDLDRKLYLACDSARELDHLVKVSNIGDGVHDASAIATRLNRLVDAGLMIRAGARYLSLAIPLGEYRPSSAVTARFSALLRQLGAVAVNGDRVLPLERLDGVTVGRPPVPWRYTPSRSERRLSASQFTVCPDGHLFFRSRNAASRRQL